MPSIIPLYGEIPNPHLTGCDIFYVLTEKAISPTVYTYTGRIGYGYECDGTHATYPVNFHATDMTDLAFEYDTAAARVTLTSGHRYTDFPEETACLKNNVEDAEADDDGGFAYIRFPRTKDGIAVARAINTIFAGKEITIVLPAQP